MQKQKLHDLDKTPEIVELSSAETNLLSKLLWDSWNISTIRRGEFDAGGRAKFSVG
jgi:hypothetical protein